MEYPSKYETLGSQTKKTTTKITTSSNWVHTGIPTSMILHRSGTEVNQSKATQKYFDPLQMHKYHTQTRTHMIVQVGGRSIGRAILASVSFWPLLITANFLMVVSPAVLAHDVSARAGDVSMGIAVYPIGWIYSGLFEKLKDG